MSIFPINLLDNIVFRIKRKSNIERLMLVENLFEHFMFLMWKRSEDIQLTIYTDDTVEDFELYLIRTWHCTTKGFLLKLDMDDEQVLIPINGITRILFTHFSDGTNTDRKYELTRFKNWWYLFRTTI